MTLPSLDDNIRMADWAHLKSEFVWAYEGAVGPSFVQTKEHLPGQSALFLLEGNLTVETAAGALIAEENQWMFPTQDVRLQKFTPDAKIISIHFHLYWPGGQPLFNPPIGYVLKGAHAQKLENKARILLRLIKRELPDASKNLPWMRGDLITHLRFQRVFDSWLCAYAEAMKATGIKPSRLVKMDPRVLQVVNILDDFPLSKPFDETEILDKTGLSSSQISRLFTKHFKVTPHQYMENRRLALAKDLLASSPLSIKQVTFELGFGSLPSFSRWFKQKTGQSPRSFKKTEQKV